MFTDSRNRAIVDKHVSTHDQRVASNNNYVGPNDNYVEVRASGSSSSGLRCDIELGRRLADAPPPVGKPERM